MLFLCFKKKKKKNLSLSQKDLNIILLFLDDILMIIRKRELIT